MNTNKTRSKIDEEFLTRYEHALEARVLTILDVKFAVVVQHLRSVYNVPSCAPPLRAPPLQAVTGNTPRRRRRFWETPPRAIRAADDAADDTDVQYGSDGNYRDDDTTEEPGDMDADLNVEESDEIYSDPTTGQEYTRPQGIQRATADQVINMFHGTRKELKWSSEPQCPSCFKDAYYDINFRAQVDRIAFQYFLLFIPSLNPWGSLPDIPAEVISAIKALRCFSAEKKNKVLEPGGRKYISVRSAVYAKSLKNFLLPQSRS